MFEVSWKDARVIKHAFNFYPEAKQQDFEDIKSSIAANGFDPKYPILVFEGCILDGWNRFLACRDLGVEPVTTEFNGSREDALQEVIKSNRRRNLTSGQRAALAAEADELIAEVAKQTEKERRKKQSNTQKGKQQVKQRDDLSRKKLRDRSSENETRKKVADQFGTNRTYVDQANSVKKSDPDTFQKLKSGKLTMQQARREAAKKPTSDWTESEKQRKELVQEGESVLANQQLDKNLINWAEKNGIAIRIDRGSKYGNPFVLHKDGDRDDICDNYADYYLPHKPSIIESRDELRGKVLICHCYPERCHGDALLKLL